MPNILEKIVATKQQEILQAKQLESLASLQEKITHLPRPLKFKESLINKANNRHPAVIAEIKQASPSKGLLTQHFDHLQLALDYQQAGATCLSVLTDEQYFQGKAEFIAQVKQIVDLPVLRKDFMIDEYHIYQSRVLGADAILLIVAILDDVQLQDYYQLALELDLSVLVEVHDRQELERALPLSQGIIGINNRNLKTFETDIHTSLNLLEHIPDAKMVVTESGIHKKEQVFTMLQNNIYGFLVGESLVKARDTQAAYTELFG